MNPVELSSERVRGLLREELMNRIRRNPNYSLRAMARSLGMHSGTLSRLISGQRPVTRKMAAKLSQTLGFTPDDEPHAEDVLNRHKTLTVDMFRLISDWYHYAILELTYVTGFRGNTRWIAKRLGISVLQVKEAVERLRRLEFLEITPEGKWIDRSGDVTTVGNDFTTAAFRKLQRQVLEMGISALESVPLERRDHSSMTFAVDTRMLPEVKTRIKKFRRELAAYIESSKARGEVYQMGIAFYPVTQGDEK